MHEHSANGRPDVPRDGVDAYGRDYGLFIGRGSEAIEIQFHGSREVVRFPAEAAVRTAEAFTETSLAAARIAACRRAAGRRRNRFQTRSADPGKIRSGLLRKIARKKSSSSDTAGDVPPTYASKTSEKPGAAKRSRSSKPAARSSKASATAYTQSWSAGAEISCLGVVVRIGRTKRIV